MALSVYLLGFSAAYVALDTGPGALILFGGVQLTMFTAALRAREAIPPRRWFGAALAFGGLAVLVGGVGLAPRDVFAVGAMAAAAVGWGVYTLIGRGATDPLAATAASFAMAVPVVGAAALVTAPELPGMCGAGLAAVSGAFTSGLGYALWYSVLPSLARSVAALAQLTVPLLAAVAGILLLAEPFILRFAAATGLIVGGVVLGTLPARRQRTSVSSGS